MSDCYLPSPVSRHFSSASPVHKVRFHLLHGLVFVLVLGTVVLHWVTIPVGMWVIRTADSVRLRADRPRRTRDKRQCADPPGYFDINIIINFRVNKRRAERCWRRPPESNGLLRTRR